MHKSSVSLILLLIACGCTSDGDPAQPPSAQPMAPPNVNPPEPPGGMKPRQMQSKGDAPAANPSMPAGAQYTIFCARIEGDLHVQRADRMKKELIASTGMPDWYVLHETGQSMLYYGYFKQLDAAARDVRSKIDLMADSMGNRPFKQAVLVELTSPDPAAPPEWNLVNAPGDCTLQIGVYMGSPQRKQAAVDAVRAARAQNVDAYYYHGPTQSLVCVGHWPASAYRVVGDAAQAHENRDPDQPLLIAPRTGDEEFNRQISQIGQRGTAKVMQRSVEILDQSLLETMRAYPTNVINGLDTGKEASQLVPIPRDAAMQGSVASQAQPGQTNPGYDATYRPNLPRRTQPPRPQPGTGRLKSIGE